MRLQACRCRVQHVDEVPLQPLDQLADLFITWIDVPTDVTKPVRLNLPRHQGEPEEVLLSKPTAAGEAKAELVESVIQPC